MAHLFDVFQNHQFLNIKTFRKSGEAVLTPVWFGTDDGKTLFVTTNTSAGKAKRIRNSNHVEIAPCGQIGNLLGDWVEAHAVILSDADQQRRAFDALKTKYGQTPFWQQTVKEEDPNRVYIAITTR